MPKIVDHAERRRTIAAAVWRVLERDGLRGASVRAVVAESGLSSGAIRHYFSDHDDLLRFAGHTVHELVPDRLTRVLRHPRLSSRRKAELLLEEMVPLDEQRATELRVFAALADLDRGRPSDRELRLRAYHGCRVVARMATLLLAGETPESGPDEPLEPRHEQLAERLHLVVDGLAGQFLFYPGLHDAAEMREILERSVAEVSSSLARVSP